jgi:diguanylate cyclase (GGDEF)-like protein
LAKGSVDLTHPDDIALTRSSFADLIEGRVDRIRLEKRYIHGDGHTVWAQVDARLLDSEPGEELQVLAQVQDISEQHLQKELLESQALMDPLTGLLNRRGFMAALELELARCKRYGKRAALLMCDLDNFKAVNDTLGRAAGDEALSRVGALLRDSLRVTDVSARYGGDEFVVLIPEATAKGASMVRESLDRKIRAAGLGIDNLPISASLGLSISRTGDSAASLLSRADREMYGNKAARLTRR